MSAPTQTLPLFDLFMQDARDFAYRADVSDHDGSKDRYKIIEYSELLRPVFECLDLIEREENGEYIVNFPDTATPSFNSAGSVIQSRFEEFMELMIGELTYAQRRYVRGVYRFAGY